MDHTVAINQTPAINEVADGLELIETTLLNNIAGGGGGLGGLFGDTGGNCLLSK